ncbi:hypothetical protein EXN66_Car007795 [Channa argus]|uniref:Ig-like domain-containing protein n=1 Tax=Channa argus TaxID=215402 RepID=A0A6G1PPG9_CHAAH|nr:hypothetical protein EXN66_Car007795 [Channa argus]
MMLKKLCCVVFVALMGLPDLGVNAQNCSTVDPWNITISGPDTVITGTLSQFTCLTSCILNDECSIDWEFSGGLPSGSLSAFANVINWTPSIPNVIQNFTCIAQNATGCSAQTTKMVKVIANPPPVTTPSSGSKEELISFAMILSMALLVLFVL